MTSESYHIPTPGEVFAGKFKIDRMLGEGGMGVVMEATHLMLKRRVAIKFPLPSLVGVNHSISRFVREARHGAAIRSEHIGRVLDIAEEIPGQPYIVMEFVPGLDLSEVLARQGPLKPRPAASFIIQACEALAEAHSLGIVHRDLKPANLFLTHRADGSLLIKVFDFGISKRPQQSTDSESEQTKSLTLTRKGAILGSPEYMAPEQFLDAGTVDTRADVWGLGVVLYELLSGHTPFSGTTVPTLLRAINAGAPRIETLRPDVPAGMAELIHSCLQADRDKRPTDVAAVARSLEPYAFATARRQVGRIERIVHPDTDSNAGPAGTYEMSLAGFEASEEVRDSRTDLPAVLAAHEPQETRRKALSSVAPRSNKTIELSEDDLLPELDAAGRRLPSLRPESRRPLASARPPGALDHASEAPRGGKTGPYRAIAVIALIVYAAAMPVIAIWISSRPTASIFITNVTPSSNEAVAPAPSVTNAAKVMAPVADGGSPAPDASATAAPTRPALTGRLPVAPGVTAIPSSQPTLAPPPASDPTRTPQPPPTDIKPQH
jgi:serine/threonine protein kinase